MAACAFSVAAGSGELVEAPGVELVRGHCTGCHSARLVAQNRGDEGHWRRLIRWMQETQGLWEIPPPQLDVIVAYLAREYPPSGQFRRKPLPAWHRPPPNGTSEQRRTDHK